ncbi:MAG: DUF2441 domain-containing protein [Clostridia bacterium]|nr:DUF2441 domain-containing protein [Clostridia bacterium]
MNVKKQTYYHIHRKNEFSHLWNVGNKINFTTRKENVFNKYYNNYYPRLKIGDTVYPMTQALDIILKQELYSNAENAKFIVENMQSVTRELAIYIRENIFEEIRANYFPTLPSRKSCLWVCREESLNFWKKEITGECQIYEVSVTGVTHCADQKYLPAEVLPCEIIRENAFNYWTGADGFNPIEEEILVEGIVDIIRRVD